MSPVYSVRALVDNQHVEVNVESSFVAELVADALSKAHPRTPVRVWSAGRRVETWTFIPRTQPSEVAA